MFFSVLVPRWFHSAALRPVAGGVLLVAVASATSEARAQPPVAKDDRRVSLSWTLGTGARDCISQPELERRVTARLGRNPFAPDAPRTLDASVKRKDGGRVAELHLREKNGAALGQRSFESTDASCSSLEDAAVLAIALLIDPEAALAAPPPPSAPGAPASAAPAAAPPPTVVTRWYPVAVPTAPAPAVPTRSGRPVRVSVGVPVHLAIGPLPRAAVGTGLWVDLEPMRRLHAVAAVSWLPEVQTSDDDFSFSLVTALVGLCGDPWSRWRWSVGVCAGLRFGAMNAVSHRLAPLDPGEQPWVEADSSIRLLLQPAGPLLLGGELAGGLVLLRPRFHVLGTDRLAFEPSAVTFAGSIWAGVRFP